MGKIMNRTFTIILAMLITAAHVATAQVARQVRFTRTSPIELAQSNYGITGQDITKLESGGFWPRGTDQQFIFGAGLWIGGLVTDRYDSIRKAVFVTYDPHTGRSAATPLTNLQVNEVGNVEVIHSRFTDTVLSAYSYNSYELESGRYPIGLQLDQTLTTQSTGQFKDVAILSTTIRNIHPTRPIQQMIVDLVVDADIGPRSNPIVASRNDMMMIIDDPDDLRIAVLSSQPHGSQSYGRLGVALVNTPDLRSVATIRDQSILLDPVSSWERYSFISTGLRTPQETPGDVKIHLASYPYTLQPGEEMTFQFVLMFSNDDESVSIPWMTNVAKHFRTNTDVSENVASPEFQLYPNPVSEGGMVRFHGGIVPQRIDILDAIGSCVQAFTTDCSSLDIKGLPAGMYFVRVYSGDRIAWLPLVIVR